MLCQAYTQVSFENEGLCAFAPNCWDSLKGDMMVDKIQSMENLMDPFTKTLIGRVYVGDKDNIGLRWVSDMLYRHNALRASVRMLGWNP